MFKSKQQGKPIPLQKLLNGLERANKYDTQAYTSGHLNHNHLFKPQVLDEKAFWKSGKKSIRFSLQSRQLQDQIFHSATEKRVKKMKDALANFTIKTSFVPGHSKIKPSVRFSTVIKSLAPSINTQFPGSFLQSEPQETCMEKQEYEELRPSFQSEELDLPELNLLTFTCGKYRNTFPDHAGENLFVSAYLAGLTKTDQFNMFAQFNRDFLRKEDLIEDFSKNTSVERYERKLAKELLKIADIRPPHYARLRIFIETFGDICDNSNVFGSILSQIKNAYEFYIEFLLDSLPSTQYQVLMSEIEGMKKRAVKTQDVEEAILAVEKLEHEAQVALDVNDQLRNQLEAELTNNTTNDNVTRSLLDSAVKKSNEKSHYQTLVDILEAKRYEILAMCSEVERLEQEIRKHMTNAVNAQATEQCIKDVKDLDSEIKIALTKQKMTLENQAEIKHLMKNIVPTEN
ncbi:uncharacterized protein C6orf118 homolog [Ascaphus truei]|uniref:uncharacterized protein C6orf118 homolog n=1 Tax=Ascaphus truei TaxID=8439 RepID=UPI003F59AB62